MPKYRKIKHNYSDSNKKCTKKNNQHYLILKKIIVISFKLLIINILTIKNYTS